MIEIVIALVSFGAGAAFSWWAKGRADRKFIETIQAELRMIQGILRAVRDGDLGPPRRGSDMPDALATAMHGPAGPEPRAGAAR